MSRTATFVGLCLSQTPTVPLPEPEERSPMLDLSYALPKESAEALVPGATTVVIATTV